MNLKVDLSEFFDDKRKLSMVYVDLQTLKTVNDVVIYICKLFKITRDSIEDDEHQINLFLGECFIPLDQSSLLFKEIQNPVRLEYSGNFYRIDSKTSPQENKSSTKVVHQSEQRAKCYSNYTICKSSNSTLNIENADNKKVCKSSNSRSEIIPDDYNGSVPDSVNGNMVTEDELVEYKVKKKSKHKRKDIELIEGSKFSDNFDSKTKKTKKINVSSSMATDPLEKHFSECNLEVEEESNGNSHLTPNELPSDDGIGKHESSDDFDFSVLDNKRKRKRKHNKKKKKMRKELCGKLSNSKRVPLDDNTKMSNANNEFSSKSLENRNNDRKHIVFSDEDDMNNTRSQNMSDSNGAQNINDKCNGTLNKYSTFASPADLTMSNNVGDGQSSSSKLITNGYYSKTKSNTSISSESSASEDADESTNCNLSSSNPETIPKQSSNTFNFKPLITSEIPDVQDKDIEQKFRNLLALENRETPKIVSWERNSVNGFSNYEEWKMDSLWDSLPTSFTSRKTTTNYKYQRNGKSFCESIRDSHVSSGLYEDQVSVSHQTSTPVINVLGQKHSVKPKNKFSSGLGSLMSQLKSSYRRVEAKTFSKDNKSDVEDAKSEENSSSENILEENLKSIFSKSEISLPSQTSNSHNWSKDEDKQNFKNISKVEIGKRLSGEIIDFEDHIEDSNCNNSTEPVDDASRSTEKNHTDILTTKEYNFELHPILNSLPKVGDIIAAQFLTLDEAMCPSYSPYQSAKVMKVQGTKITLHFIGSEANNQDEEITTDWRELHFPRLLFP